MTQPIEKMEWKQLPKDIGKFYFFLITIYIFLASMMWGYEYIWLETQKIKSAQHLGTHNLPASSAPFTEIFWYILKYPALITASIFTFCQIPPRPVRYIITYTAIIFFINALFTIRSSVIEYTFDYLFLIICLTAASIDKSAETESNQTLTKKNLARYSVYVGLICLTIYLMVWCTFYGIIESHKLSMDEVMSEVFEDG